MFRTGCLCLQLVWRFEMTSFLTMMCLAGVYGDILLWCNQMEDHFLLLSISLISPAECPINGWFCHRCRPPPPLPSLSKFPSLSLLLDWRLDPPFSHRCVSVRSAPSPYVCAVPHWRHQRDTQPSFRGLMSVKPLFTKTFCFKIFLNFSSWKRVFNMGTEIAWTLSQTSLFHT